MKILRDMHARETYVFEIKYASGKLTRLLLNMHNNGFLMGSENLRTWQLHCNRKTLKISVCKI